jgi:hypothetical protein
MQERYESEGVVHFSFDNHLICSRFDQQYKYGGFWTTTVMLRLISNCCCCFTGLRSRQRFLFLATHIRDSIGSFLATHIRDSINPLISILVPGRLDVMLQIYIHICRHGSPLTAHMRQLALSTYWQLAVRFEL